MKGKPLWQVFSNLVNLVKDDHDYGRKATGGGHDFIHALMVAQYGPMIAEDERTGILAWIGGLIHNTDHIFPEREVLARLNFYIEEPSLQLTGEEEQRIIVAVLTHSELNSPNDNPVTVVLKDADKLANIGPNIFIRFGQFRPNIPAFNPRWVEESDPESSYKNPKTVLRDIMSSLEWKGKDVNGNDYIRLPKAKELAKEWFKMLELFIQGFAKQLREVDLLPYPFKD